MIEKFIKKGTAISKVEKIPENDNREPAEEQKIEDLRGFLRTAPDTTLERASLMRTMLLASDKRHLIKLLNDSDVDEWNKNPDFYRVLFLRLEEEKLI